MNILNEMTLKSLKLNKKRTLLTTLGIILSASLIIGIGLLFASFYTVMLKDVVRTNGDHHISLVDVDEEAEKFVNNQKGIKLKQELKLMGFANYTDDGTKASKLYNANVGFLNHAELISGKLPTSNNEIVVYDNDKNNYKLGDIVTLKISEVYIDGELVDYLYVADGDGVQKITDIANKEYKIVGFIKTDNLNEYNIDNVFITTNEIIETNYMKEIKLTFEKEKNIYKELEFYEKNLGNTSVIDNDIYLTMTGNSRYVNVSIVIVLVATFIMAIVAVGCIIVIYNSFSISVLERKRQFGLYSSIGATKKQIMKSVLFEGFVLGFIGLVIGTIGAIVGIQIVIKIVNLLVGKELGFNFILSFNKMYMIISYVVMLIVIFVSSYLPAKMASKFSPIESIRQSDDIKLSKKKIKTSKLFDKIFKIEGVIALKNLKRNKKRYRAPLIALVVSIVLFITFSGVMLYFTNSIDYAGIPDADIIVALDNVETNNILKDITPVINGDLVTEKVSYIENIHLFSTDISNLTDKYKDTLDDEAVSYTLVKVDDNTYNKLKKENDIKENVPLILNNLSIFTYTSNKRVLQKGEKLQKLSKDLYLNYYNYGEDITEEDEPLLDYNFGKSKLIKTNPIGFNNIFGSDVVGIIVNDKLFGEITSKVNFDITSTYNILLNTTDSTKLEKELKALVTKYEGSYVVNVEEEFRSINNIVIVSKILVYGFVTLVTLIGITSVLNTISTSMMLRSKDFAVLRSVGMDTKGFNRMIYFESIFFGLKSLMIGLPLSLGLVTLLYFIMNGIVEGSFLFPYGALLITVVFIFVLILLTMMYSTRKSKTENIVESLKRENI